MRCIYKKKKKEDRRMDNFYLLVIFNNFVDLLFIESISK